MATERRLRICMLAGNPLMYDGRVLRHAETLARAGHRLHLIGVKGPNDPAADGPVLAAVPGLSVQRIDRRRVGIAPRLLWLTSALRRRAAAFATAQLGPRFPLAELAVAPCALELLAAALLSDAEVFHANDLDTLVPAAWAATLLGRRYVYDAHELYADERPALSTADRRARAEVEARLMPGAAANFTVNALLAAELARRYGIAPPQTLHNVPSRVPEPGERRTQAPVTAFTVERPLRLLLHGSWVGLDQPGVDSALQAVAEVPLVTLTLRGGVRDEAALRARIQALRIGDRVALRPRLPGAEALVAAAIAEDHDVGLSVHLPDCESRRLATSSKVFEYLMAGLCVVASDQLGNRHILGSLSQGNDVGLLFSPDSAVDLATKLRSLLADPVTLQARKRAARQVAETTLCWEHERSTLLATYQDLGLAAPRR